MESPRIYVPYVINQLVEFTYNNGYQASLKMITFEVLYGRKCRVPISWSRIEDQLVLGPDLLKDTE